MIDPLVDSRGRASIQKNGPHSGPYVAYVASGPRAGRPYRHTGFTLIEMMVVIVIILVIVGLVVPSARSIWEERKKSVTINKIEGLLKNARVRSLESEGVWTGFFSFIDQEGTQHLAPIEQAAVPPGSNARSGWRKIFFITEDADQMLPAPMRVLPRYAVEDPSTSAFSYETFSDDELDNPNVVAPLSPVDQAQRHRNHFSMIFDDNGQLLVGKDVLILDTDADEDEVGDRTGLPVGKGGDDTATAGIQQYYQRETNSSATISDGIMRFPFLVREASSDTALNFPSVDGLLVYDDAVFRTLPAEDKRDLLIRTALPLYISRFTGAIVQGAIGENESP